MIDVSLVLPELAGMGNDRDQQSEFGDVAPTVQSSPERSMIEDDDSEELWAG